MRINLFTIPVHDVTGRLDDLNSFLSSNKIIEFEKHLLSTPSGFEWSFYIVYDKKLSRENYLNNTSKIDYKSVLPDHEFKKYEILRIIRKKLAKEDAVSAFVVATNDEIADIARLSVLNLDNIRKINGFGDKKTEKYGKRIIEEMKNYEEKPEK